MIIQTYEDFSIHHQLFKKYRRLFKHTFDSVGFTYVSRLPKIMQDLLRVHHRIFRVGLKRAWTQNVLDPSVVFFESWVSHTFQSFENRGVQHVRHAK